MRVAEGDVNNSTKENSGCPIKPILEEEGDGVTSSEDGEPTDGEVSCSSGYSVINPTAISKTLMDVEVLHSGNADPSPIKKVEKVEVSGEVLGSTMEGMKAFWNAIQVNDSAPGTIMMTYMKIHSYNDNIYI